MHPVTNLNDPLWWYSRFPGGTRHPPVRQLLWALPDIGGQPIDLDSQLARIRLAIRDPVFLRGHRVQCHVLTSAIKYLPR